MKKFILWSLGIIWVIILALGMLLSETLAVGPFNNWLEEFIKPFIDVNNNPPGPIWVYLVVFYILITLVSVFLAYKDKFLPKVKDEAEEDMRKFITNFTEHANKKHYVVATQIYRYKFSKTNYKVKINYEDGYVIEEERINAVIQEHFEVDKNLFKELDKIVKAIRKDENDLNSIDRFMTRLIDKLDHNPRIIDLNKELNQFNLLVLAIQFFLSVGNTADDFLGANKLISILNHGDKENELYTRTRTGLTRAIINAELNMSSLYCFEHIGKNDKSGRVYLTIKVKRKNDPTPYIFLITVSSKIEEEPEQVTILTEVLNDFIHQLEKELGITEVQNLRLVV